MTSIGTDRSDIIETIRGYAASELAVAPDSLGDDTHLRDSAGADSIKLLRIVAQVEREYDAEFEDEDVFKVHSLAELADLVQAQQGQAG